MLDSDIPYSFFGIGSVRRFIYKQNVLNRFENLEGLGSFVLRHLDRQTGISAVQEGKECDSVYRDLGVQIIGFYDRLYPSLLREIYDPPIVLYLMGNPEMLNSRWIGVVGTRKASPISLFATKQLVSFLGSRNPPQPNLNLHPISNSNFEISQTNDLSLGIVSGMALGIDKEAMNTAFQLGMPVLGVLGTPVHKEYPHSNKNLYRMFKSSDKCLFLSELLPYDNYAKWTFPMRNRIITGIAESIYLMETPLKSGAMSSANNAITQNKELYVFDHPYQYRNDGGRCLIEDGATPIGIEDIGFSGRILYKGDLENQSTEEEGTLLNRLSLLKEQEALGHAENLGDGYYCIF